MLILIRWPTRNLATPRITALSGMHPIPYREYVRIVTFDCIIPVALVNRVVSIDEFGENVDILVRVFIGEILVQVVA